MGSRLVKYEFSPKENEQIEAVIKVPEEKRSVIHGVVIDCKNRPIRDAVVKLLEVIPGNPCRMKPLTHTFTDSCGQFLFGPLHFNKKYALKVWYSDIKIRELIISPDCDEHCEDVHGDDCSDNECSDDYNDAENSDTYEVGHYDGHCDIDFNDYLNDHSDEQYEESRDGHSDDHGYREVSDRREQCREDKRRDRHSNDDNYIHYKAPKVYGQKCSKCDIKKNKVNNFEDIEK